MWGRKPKAFPDSSSPEEKIVKDINIDGFRYIYSATFYIYIHRANCVTTCPPEAAPNHPSVDGRAINLYGVIYPECFTREHSDKYPYEMIVKSWTDLLQKK